MSILSKPYLHNEEAAYKFVESSFAAWSYLPQVRGSTSA